MASIVMCWRPDELPCSTPTVIPSAVGKPHHRSGCLGIDPGGVLPRAPTQRKVFQPVEAQARYAGILSVAECTTHGIREPHADSGHAQTRCVRGAGAIIGA